MSTKETAESGGATPAPRVGGKLVAADNAGGFVCRTEDGRESADYSAPDGETEGNQCTIADEKPESGE